VFERPPNQSAGKSLAAGYVGLPLALRFAESGAQKFKDLITDP